MNNNISKIILWSLYVLIFVFSIGVRFWGLDSAPPSMNFDEAALGYNAYSLSETGRDEYGNFLPLSLRSFNDYKPALYSYFSIIPIRLLGLNDVSTRVVSAISGVLTIFLLFFILKEFFPNRIKHLVAFSVVAIQPWLLHYSRTAFESNLASMFFLGGVLFLLRNKPLWSTIPFALSAYGYHSPRLAGPILLFLYLADKAWPKIRNVTIKKALPLIVLALLVVPIFLSSRNSLIFKRYQQTNIFKVNYPFAPKELLADKNPWLSFPNNPIYYLGGLLVGHAAAYFSPINLGERIYHTVRYSSMYIPSFGILGWFESFSFFFGLIAIFRLIDGRNYRLLIFWVLAGSAPAIVTWDWFHPLRSLTLFPAALIISIMGLFFLADRFIELFTKISPTIKASFVKIVLVIIFVLMFIPTAIFVIENELVYMAWSNHGEYQPGGYKEGIPILVKIQDKYDKVIVDTPHAQAYIFFLFYQRFPPREIQKYAQVRPSPLTEGDLTFNFYKYEFRKIDWPKDKFLHHVVFWASPDLNIDEVKESPGTSIIEIKNAIGTSAAFIITKE